MKRAIVAVLLVVLLASGLLVGCAGGVVVGSGELATREFNFGGFTRVEVGYAFEVEVVRSDSYSVRITADDNLFEYIRVSKAGETLKIGLTRWMIIPWMTIRAATLRAEVTMPDLYGLHLSGATSGTLQGFSSSHYFILELSGASSVNMIDMSVGDVRFGISGASKATGDLAAADAKIDVSGASNVELRGSASDVVLEGSGASRVELVGFLVNNADVKLSGASTGTVNLNGRLDADLSGASRLSYAGEPTMGDIRMSGGSTLSKK